MKGPRTAIRVKYVLTHPIQYMSPILRKLAGFDDIDLLVIFGADAGASSFFDSGFFREITWRGDLLDGYPYLVLSPGAGLDEGFFSLGAAGAARRLKKDDTDLVICHGWGPPLYKVATASAIARGIPLIYRTDAYKYYDPSLYRPSGWPRRLLRGSKPLVLRRLFNRVDGFLALGTFNKQYYLDHGVSEEKIFVVPHAIDLSDGVGRLGPGSAGAKAREIGLAEDSFKVLFSGKLVRRKRPFDIIEAVARMPSRQKVEVVFIGDGELLDYTRSLARLRGVRAFFPGFINLDELPLYYSLGDVVVLPSLTEPWGLVVNEAMSMGTPAIVSDRVGAGPDMVIEGESGFVFPVREVEVLAALLEKMASSHRLCETLSQGALRMSQEFCLQRTIDGYREAIHAIAARRGQDPARISL